MTRDILLNDADIDYLAYDLDRSGGLSAPELERATDGDVASLLEDRLRDSRLTERQAAEWLLTLSASKAARVLSYFDDRRVPSVLREASRQNPTRCLRIQSFRRENVVEPEAGEIDDRPAAISRTDIRPVRAAVTRERTTVLPMRAYAVAGSGARDHLLTADVSTCTVLTLYDPVRRIGAMAHFDVGSDYQNSLDLLFADLEARGIQRGGLVARIVGGNASMATSRRLTGELEERLRLEGVSVLETERDGDGWQARNFVLDLRTGALEAYRGPYLTADPTARDGHHPTLLGRTGP